MRFFQVARKYEDLMRSIDGTTISPSSSISAIARGSPVRNVSPSRTANQTTDVLTRRTISLNVAESGRSRSRRASDR